jgi:hypothetical protein
MHGIDRSDAPPELRTERDGTMYWPMLAPRTALFRLPLIRLLAINLAGGVVVALLLLGGLLVLNPHHLRDLIVADHDPGAALALLAFGFLITFGSAAMGTAIMMLPRKDKRGGSRCRCALPRGEADVRGARRTRKLV